MRPCGCLRGRIRYADLNRPAPPGRPQLDEIMKECFNSKLVGARSERDRVNSSFMQASSAFESETKAFGHALWGWSW